MKDLSLPRLSPERWDERSNEDSEGARRGAILYGTGAGVKRGLGEDPQLLDKLNAKLKRKLKTTRKNRERQH